MNHRGGQKAGWPTVPHHLRRRNFSGREALRFKTRTIPGEPGWLVTPEDGKVFLMCPSLVPPTQMLEPGQAFEWGARRMPRAYRWNISNTPGKISFGGIPTLPQERVQGGITRHTMPVEVSPQPAPKLSSGAKPGSVSETSKTRIWKTGLDLVSLLGLGPNLWPRL